MNLQSRPSAENERGAVAIMVAVLAGVLVIVAALSVDLGNAWARGRAVQKQADISAIGAGSLLPMTSLNRTAIAERATELLNKNKAAGQPDAVAGSLLDGIFDNGEITFLNNAGGACSDMCTRMTISPPSARVDFGLAGAVASGTNVVRSATVQIFSELPPNEKIIPLWLPSGCGFGPVDGDTEQGPTTTTTTTTTTSPTSPTSSPSESVGAVLISPVGGHVIGGTSPVDMAAGTTRTMSGYTITNAGNNVEKASIRMIAPDGSRYIEYAVTLENNSSTIPTFQLGTEVSNTVGAWKMYAIVQEKGTNKPLNYSSNNLVINVTGTATDPLAATPSDVPVGCAGQDRGNFGQLYSPRIGITNASEALAHNLAFGLDHSLVPFDAVALGDIKECADSNGNNSIEGAQLDDESEDGNNCIRGDTGNDGPKLFDGLIGVVDSKPGRLNVAGDPTRNTSPLCSSRSNAAVGSYTINNDVLSCFLRGTGTLEKIAQSSGVDDSMLDPAVKDSPRFVWLPMVYATDRAQKGFQPILDFVPAFITDETQTVPATDANGLEVNGNSISVVRLFAFNKAALPPDEQSPNTAYDETLGAPIVRLIG